MSAPAGAVREAVDGVSVSVSGSIATVTIAGPNQRNSITLHTWRTLASIFEALAGDRSVRAVVLEGAGGDFSTGADISEFSAVRANAEQAEAYEAAVDACADAIFHAPQPTIAAIRGYCLGGACHLALACDFRFADPSARIGIPAARLSIVYGVRSTQRLASLVGLSAAKRILFGGERLDAAQALRLGLVDEACEDVGAAARDFARVLAANAPLSVAGSKFILNAIAMGPGALDPEAAAGKIAQAAASADYEEGRRAFAEKRAPLFRGE